MSKALGRPAMLDIRQQMTTHIDALSGDQVKSLVLSWLSETGGTLTDFEQLLNGADQETQNPLQYGALDDRGEFQPFSEDEQIQLSLAAFADYRLNGGGVSNDRVSEWLESIGTHRPLPCPQ